MRCHVAWRHDDFFCLFRANGVVPELMMSDRMRATAPGLRTVAFGTACLKCVVRCVG